MTTFFPHAATALLVTLALPMQAAPVPTPARVLNPQYETSWYPSMQHLGPANHPFQFSAAVKVYALGKGSASSVKHRDGSTAAVYRGKPAASPAEYLPNVLNDGPLIDFANLGDLTQAWATMDANGVPHLRATGYGDSSAEAMASWSTTVTVPADAGQRKLVVRFVLPQVSVGGNTEFEGKDLWRARMRAELLVNGYPAWSTEAIRYNGIGNNSVSTQMNAALQTFGQPLAFPTNDTDASADNDTTSANLNFPSTAKEVYVTLGYYPAGSVIDLAMVHRANAHTVPTSLGLTDNKCIWKYEMNRWFCSQAAVSITGGSASSGPRIYLEP
ncbi:hypothetical protein [Ideonella sp. A 288]|uniref:hypothetical protein n=1 Tax=Ideonella sp. A 288 TaxID=1962181 RepID=UPI000B4AA3DD|nr:hypothetical protein [Ideonella sp. A 288]